MNRRHRLIASTVAAFALVFAQFAAVAHACDLHSTPAPTEVMAHNEGCPGSNGSGPASTNENVCAEHCQYGVASVDSSQPAPDTGDSAGPAFRIDSPDLAASQGARQEWLLPLAAPPPSPAILFGVLRL